MTLPKNVNNLVEMKRPVLMVGPDLEGSGGISRVAKNWFSSKLFSKNRVTYVATVTDSRINSIILLTKAILRFYFLLVFRSWIVYVYTSSFIRFYRKSFFLIPAIILRKNAVLHIHPSHFYEFIISLKGFKKTIVFL